jgi:hypothetical protein
MRESVKKYDEVAFRLWWEGHDVEFDLVRGFLVKMAERWDERMTKVNQAVDSYTDPENWDDDLDPFSIAMNSKSLPPPLGTIRKRLGRQADEYLDFIDLFIGIMRGTLGQPTTDHVDLFRKAIGWDPPGGDLPEVDELMGADTLELIQESLARPFVDLATDLSEESLAGTRSMLITAVQFVSQLGEILKGSIGGTGSGYGLAASALAKGLTESEGQAHLLLLLSTTYERPEVQAYRAEFQQQARDLNNVAYHDYLRLRYLVEAVPGFDKVITPYQMKMSLKSPAGQERLTKKIKKFRANHAEALDMAFAARPDLFPPEVEEA